MDLNDTNDKEMTEGELERISQHCADDMASCALRITNDKPPIYVCNLIPITGKPNCKYNGNIITYEGPNKQAVTKYQCNYVEELAKKLKQN